MNITADLLMQGPRGRRFVLSFARASDVANSTPSDSSFASLLFHAAYDLDPGKGTSVVLLGSGLDESVTATPDAVSVALDAVRLAEPTADVLVRCLAEAVDSARYWQEPDGTDVLADAPEMSSALHRVAEHIAGSPWWGRGGSAQWLVTWESGAQQPTDPRALLRDWHENALAHERQAEIERPSDPTALWSGVWWSTPPQTLAHTAPELHDGVPSGLRFVEDGLGWTSATAVQVEVPPDGRVYEIDSAAAWAALCARFPLDVTASKRHDWYRTTHRRGRWVMPDWLRVAEHFDGVHLQTGAYLAAAGTAINVDDDTASVIAGWNPDETYWFTPRIRLSGGEQQWRVAADQGDEWVRA